MTDKSEEGETLLVAIDDASENEELIARIALSLSLTAFFSALSALASNPVSTPLELRSGRRFTIDSRNFGEIPRILRGLT
jgi:hypothetical protein